MAMQKQSGEAEQKERARFDKKQFKRSLQVFAYLLPYRWSFALGMFFLFAGSLLFLAIMKLPGEMFNIVSGESRYGLSLTQVFLLLLLLLGVQSVLSYFRVQLFAIVSEKSMASLRAELYEKLVSLGIPFLESRRIGELTSRMTNDVTQVQGVFSVTLAEFLRQLIVLLGGVGIIIFSMPRVALTMLATFPVVVVLAMFFGRHIRRLMKSRQDQLASTNVVVEETMQAIQTVKAYTNEALEVKRYRKALDESVRFGDPRAFEAADIVILKAAPLGGVAAAPELARSRGGPVVVSGSLDSAVGLVSGLALAAALTGDPPACGLGTGTLLARDVIAPPLVPFDGHMPVERIAPDLDALMAARDLIGDQRARWWRQRLADAWEAGGAGLVEAMDA